MERPEIISGLKHAIERGYSLEMAVQSFINAGYNSQDVQDSAKIISGGVLSQMDTTQQPNPKITIQLPKSSQPSIIQPQKQPPKIQSTQLPKIPSPSIQQQVQPRQNPYQYSQNRQSMQQSTQSKFPTLPTLPVQDINPEKSDNNLIILLVLILIFLLGILGLLIFARTTILSWFS